MEYNWFLSTKFLNLIKIFKLVTKLRETKIIVDIEKTDIFNLNE